MLSARTGWKARMLSTVAPLQNMEKSLTEETSKINTPVSSQRRHHHRREQSNMSPAHPPYRSTIVPAHQLNEGHHQRQATITPVTVPHIASANNTIDYYH